jgi:hypothetical protein
MNSTIRNGIEVYQVNTIIHETIYKKCVNGCPVKINEFTERRIVNEIFEE